MNLRWTLLAALVGGGLLAGPMAQAQLSGPIPSGKVRKGVLSFDGHASVGDFVGTTDTMTGEVTGSDQLEAVRGWVEAPVKTLKTKNGKRDKDLNKSMESDKYPTMRFDLDGVKPGVTQGDSTAVTLLGRLTIHGVTREVTLPGWIRQGDGGIRLRSDFPLNLKDYQIGGLTKMLGMLKMQEDIEVHVDLTFGP